LLYRSCEGETRARDWVAAGLFGARESRWLDVYALNADETDGDACRRGMHSSITAFLARCGVKAVLAVAGERQMGAITAHKWVYPLTAGSEAIMICALCGYAASRDVARWRKDVPEPQEALPLGEVETPGCKTIADLAAFLRISQAQTAKALFMVTVTTAGSRQFALAVVRGDYELSEAKLMRALDAQAIAPATEAEIRAVGAEPGYGSPFGLRGVTVVVDDLVASTPNLVAGANRLGYHLVNVNIPRDYAPSVVADIARARDGDACPDCGSPMNARQGAELAAIEKLGADAARLVAVGYLDSEGEPHPVMISCARVYVDRVLAAVAEAHHDGAGLTWPELIAPFRVYLMTAGKVTLDVAQAADDLYAALQRAGVEVLYDDRDERAGVKFNDADLIGLPLRVTVGERGLRSGVVELKRRGGSEVEQVNIEQLPQRVAGIE
jgi:prolyl-tRNA synthetase